MSALAFVLLTATASAALDSRRVEINSTDTTVVVEAAGDGPLRIDADGEVHQEATYGAVTRIHCWGEGTLVVHMPAGIGLEVFSRSGDVQVGGRLARLRVNTASGDVALRADAQRIDITTVSGDITLDGGAPRLEISSISGDIGIDGTSGDAVLQTTSGELTWDGPWPRHLDFRTVSGDADMRGVLVADAIIRIRSASGDVRLDPRGAVGYRLEARSHSGEITVGEVSGNQVDTLVRGGGATIEVRTFSGDVAMMR